MAPVWASLITKAGGHSLASSPEAFNDRTTTSFSNKSLPFNSALYKSRSLEVACRLVAKNPTLPAASSTKAKSSSTLLMGAPKCSGWVQPPALFRVVRYTSKPPIPSAPLDAKNRVFPSAATKGVISSPHVLTLLPNGRNLLQRPSSSISLSKRSKPPMLFLDLTLAINRLLSGKKATSPWVGMFLSMSNGSAEVHPLSQRWVILSSWFHPSLSTTTSLSPNASEPTTWAWLRKPTFSSSGSPQSPDAKRLTW